MEGFLEFRCIDEEQDGFEKKNDEIGIEPIDLYYRIWTLKETFES